MVVAEDETTRMGTEHAVDTTDSIGVQIEEAGLTRGGILVACRRANGDVARHHRIENPDTAGEAVERAVGGAEGVDGRLILSPSSPLYAPPGSAY